MFSKGLLLLAIVLLNGAAADDFDDDEISSAEGRKLRDSTPDWWELVKSDYEGNDLRMCSKKQDNPPSTGRKCSKRVKTCFFGTQLCAGDVSYPSQKCRCDGKQATQTWTCEDTECPINAAPPPLVGDPPLVTDAPPPPNVFPPPLLVDENGCPLDGAGFEIFNEDRCPATAEPGGTCTADQEGISCEWGLESCCGKCFASMRCNCSPFGSWDCLNTDACYLGPDGCPDDVIETEEPIPRSNENGCPLDGAGFEIFNDDLCPATVKPNEACTADQEGLSCEWGQESCCGKCNASMRCSCSPFGSWMCLNTDACYFPSCYTKEWYLNGSTCEEAKSEVLAAYPGMNVICLTATDPMPTEDDLERYIVIVDGSGLVTDVVLNRNAECPTAEVFSGDTSCSTPGQHCEIIVDVTTVKDQTCTETDICTCQFGEFVCNEQALGCVVDVNYKPPVEDDTVDENGCPLEGAGFESLNGLACPATSPLLGVPGASCSADAEGVNCQYGMETCCGKCYASQRVSCNEGDWIGYNTDACMSPNC